MFIYVHKTNWLKFVYKFTRNKKDKERKKKKYTKITNIRNWREEKIHLIWQMYLETNMNEYFEGTVDMVY